MAAYYAHVDGCNGKQLESMGFRIQPKATSGISVPYRNENTELEKHAIALITGTGILMLILAATMLLQLRYHTYDPVQAAYLKFCDKLAKKGIPRKPYEGARDYAERLAELRQDSSQTTNAISELYIALRYGTLEKKEAVQELQRRVAEFRT